MAERLLGQFQVPRGVALAGLAGAVRPQRPRLGEVAFRQATVVSVQYPSYTVSFDGGVTSLAGVLSLAGYRHAAGQVVEVLVRPGDPLIVGSTAGGAVRVGGDVQTVDSGSVTTTETEVLWGSGPMVSGEKYAVRVWLNVSSSVAGDNGLVRIRKDDASGVQLQQMEKDLPATGYPVQFELYAEYTATATATTFFVTTVVRASGSGNLRREASSTQPSYMTLERVV